MCVLFFYVNDNLQLNKYRLIIVNNRDEKFDCLIKFLDYWDSDKNCLSGQDLQSGVEYVEGCMWLGMFKMGKVGVLLNIKEILEEDKESRGCLVKDFFLCDFNCQFYIEKCVKFKQDFYNGFYFLLLDCRFFYIEMIYFNNRDSDMKNGEILLVDKCVCLGNFLFVRISW